MEEFRPGLVVAVALTAAQIVQTTHPWGLVSRPEFADAAPRFGRELVALRNRVPTLYLSNAARSADKLSDHKSCLSARILARCASVGAWKVNAGSSKLSRS